jgi:hypothetical protein
VIRGIGHLPARDSLSPSLEARIMSVPTPARSVALRTTVDSRTVRQT